MHLVAVWEAREWDLVSFTEMDSAVGTNLRFATTNLAISGISIVISGSSSIIGTGFSLGSISWVTHIPIGGMAILGTLTGGTDTVAVR